MGELAVKNAHTSKRDRVLRQAAQLEFYGRSMRLTAKRGQYPTPAVAGQALRTAVDLCMAVNVLNEYRWLLAEWQQMQDLITEHRNMRDLIAEYQEAALQLGAA